jgi:hypothetical protein
MKAMALGLVGTLTVGTWCLGGFSRADVDRTVAMPPDKVYAAFSEAFGSSGSNYLGEVNGPDGARDTLTSKVEKKRGKSLELSATYGSKQLLDLRITLEPAAGGNATHILADGDMDASLFSRQARNAPPQAVVSWAANQAVKVVINRAIDDIVAGRPIKRMSLATAGRNPNYERPIMSKYDLEERYGDHKVKPMVDPDEVARQHSFPESNPRYR